MSRLVRSARRYLYSRQTLRGLGGALLSPWPQPVRGAPPGRAALGSLQIAEGSGPPPSPAARRTCAMRRRIAGPNARA